MAVLMTSSKFFILTSSLILIASSQVACSNHRQATESPTQKLQPVSSQPSPLLTPSSILIKFKDMDASQLGIPAQRIAEINQVLNKINLQAAFEMDHFEGIKTIKLVSPKGALTEKLVETAAQQLKAQLSYVEWSEVNKVRQHKIF